MEESNGKVKYITPQQKPFILALFAYGAQRDIETSALSQASGIDPLRLLNDNNYAVEQKQLNDLWSAATTLSKDKLFGLHFGESLQLAALGVVGEIIKTSETVGQAISISASLTPLITDAITMSVQYDGSTIRITFTSTEHVNENITKQIAEFLLAFTIQELDGFLFKKVKPKQVTFPFSDAASDYTRVLRCVPKMGSVYEIVFESGYWNEPIITANYDAQKHLLSKVSVVVESSESFQIKVMEYLTKNAFLGILSLEDVAANFNITSRSLQRRLQEESTTFQQIADDVRKSIALHYLESGKYRMKEISNILGYNEVSAFSRAFKRWTGRAPMEYLA
ncbi:MAG TPA: AraC family transcriptional regulator ligand-binding domain-containing protein [Ohtaekwangia sp.]|nr:AraC family transcriptional regulator ligand-binding domain-containing protein [Ohtaekwangia sp.]